MGKKMDILYACNDSYAPFAGTSIFSLLENNSSIQNIRIFIVLDHVSMDNQRKLTETVEEYGQQIVLIDAEEVNALLEKLGVPMYRGSYATHYRKFFSMFLPEDVERLLYIDSDSVVLGDLGWLVDCDLQGKCIGVVLDALGGRYKRLLGFEGEEPYFNAGVTLIDVEKWKLKQYSNQLLEHIINVRAKYCNPDQDLFNIILKDDVFILPLEYNFQPVHRGYSDKVYFNNYPKQYYTTEEIEYARRYPKILHMYRYLGEFPWHIKNCHPDNDVFDLYLRKSIWKDYQKKDSKRNFVFKFEKMMYKHINRSVFLYVFSKVLYYNFWLKNRRLKRG